MSWHGIEGHDARVEQFRHSLRAGRLASTFLFVGPGGIGKRAFAEKFAQALLCQQRPDTALDPCEVCPSCQQVLAGTHPDLLRIAKPKDRTTIPVRLLIGEGDKRMQEGLCHDISLKPFMGGRRIAIIDDADFLNEESANCLLKTLEEPPPRSVMILIGTSPQRQLPTIRSRAQLIRFDPLPPEILKRLILQQELTTDPELAARLAEQSEGSLETAAELADPALWDFRGELLNQLAQPQVDGVRLARRVAEFIDAAGKDAAPRRARARQLVRFAAEFYRQWLRALSGAAVANDALLADVVAKAMAEQPRDAESLADCAERCLAALEQIDRNANQAAWLECWLNELAMAP